MSVLSLLADFGAGAFLCNSIPHLAAGLRGELFPSPFASPPGKGNSHPVVNVIWGMANVVVGLVLIGYAPISIGLNLPFVMAIVGANIGGGLVAKHFNLVRQGKADDQ
jgi:hypothetical protein